MSPVPDDLTRALTAAEPRFAHYESAGAAAGARRNIQILRSVAKRGLPAVLARRSSEEAKEAVTGLVELFQEIGASAVLLTGTQRGGDFLNRQLLGQWAERVCCSMELPEHVLLPFGPSGAAMPGDADHARVVRSYGEISLVEGKRPDLIAVDRGWWKSASKEERERAESWPHRTLDAEDESLLSHARAGVEVKSSLWHYETRRESGGGPLSITVKHEEVESLTAWSERKKLPVVFLQVLFDEIYCMSFRRMLRAIKAERLYIPGDYISGTDRKTGKPYHRFLVSDPRHLCARTVFPDRSEAHVPVLPGGSVIPHVRLAPARARDVRSEVVEAEIEYTD